MVKSILKLHAFVKPNCLCLFITFYKDTLKCSSKRCCFLEGCLEFTEEPDVILNEMIHKARAPNKIN